MFTLTDGRDIGSMQVFIRLVVFVGLLEYQLCQGFFLIYNGISIQLPHE